MRGWWLWVTLWAVPAWAADDQAGNAAAELAEMNAVNKVWDRYAELSSGGDKSASAALLAQSSLAHFGFLRDAALYASADQLRRLPAEDRIKIYLLRATQDTDALRGMDDLAVARLSAGKGWSTLQRTNGEPITLSHVTVIGDRAVGEMAPPTETYFQFGPDFIREQGQWKYRLESSVQDASAAFDQSVSRAGVSVTQMTEYVLGQWLQADGNVPRLALLDRPLADDAGARIHLNEIWPDYKATYRWRVQAVRRKAEAGDSLAQYALGSMMMQGDSTDYVKQDEAEGIRWLERASDNGHANAAAWVAGWLMRDPAQYDEVLFKRALPHIQRAANASNGIAMSTLGHFYFDGVGGLPRDCRQAAEWQARAEEAGLEHARNEQVWTWATCPIAEQRDPAKALALAQYMITHKATLGASELDTVAAALAANGKFEEAASFQSEAIARIAEDIPDRKAQAATVKRMRARLNGYRKGRDYVMDYNQFEEQKAGKY